MESAARGLFITFEGIDGSGKSTQAALLADWFRRAGRPVHATQEPSGGPVGMLLRLALAGRLGQRADAAFQPLDEPTMALLFAADRMDHLATEIVPKLDGGTTVICDRYTLSTFAYQSIGADLSWLRALNAQARVPDLTLVIDMSPEIGLARMQARGAAERYEQAETLSRIHNNFHRLIPLLQAEGQHIVLMDGTAPPDDVHAAVVAIVRKSLNLG